MHGRSSRFDRRSVAASIVAFLAMLVAAPHADAQIDIAGAANDVCGVMAGTQKADGRTLQLVTMVEGSDFADADPIALALTTRVLHQCPKAYLAFKQRMRTNGPSLNLLGTPVALLGPGATPAPATPTLPPGNYPLRCKTPITATARDKTTLVVPVSAAPAAWSASTSAGTCAFDDRRLRASEPTTMLLTMKSDRAVAFAIRSLHKAQTITFWIHRDGHTFRIVAVSPATPAAPGPNDFF